MFWKLLELCPTPEAAVAADTAAIRDIIAPLGLHNKRAVAVQRLSQDYLQKEVRVWVCGAAQRACGGTRAARDCWSRVRCGGSMHPRALHGRRVQQRLLSGSTTCTAVA